MNIIHVLGSSSVALPNSSPTRSEQIVAAARELFAASGYDGTSIAAIARCVGVADGAIYRHFESKRDILHAVIAGFYEPLIASASTAVSGVTDPRDRLRVLVRHNLIAYTEDPAVCRLIIAEARVLDGYFESEVADLGRRYTALAVAALRDGVAAGVFRADIAPAMVRDVLFGAMEHMAWGALTGHGTIDIERTTDTLMSTIVDGISAGSSGASPDEAPAHCQTPPFAEQLGDQIDRLETLLSRLEAGGRMQ